VALQQRYNIRKRYTSAADLLADPEIDVVSIALPTFLHAPVAIAALNAGKHVLLDKPFAMNGSPSAKYGVAAGTYSMIRFLGLAVSAAIAGVALERFLSGGLEIEAAFRLSFLISAAIWFFRRPPVAVSTGWLAVGRRGYRALSLFYDLF